MWGFITVTNDVLINAFKGIFELSAPERALIQFAFFGAFFFISLIYFLISSFSGKDPINKVGYKLGMTYGLLICSVGCFLFYPAAVLETYVGFLLALFVLASGVTLLQICANPYATILGTSDSASSRLNLAQGLNSLGTTLGPIIGTILIYKVFSSGNSYNVEVFAVAKTYLIYGLVFLGLAVLTLTSKLPPFINTEKMESGIAVLKNRHLLLGVIAIFLYVGSEVAVGSWIVEFIKLDKIAGLTEANANYYLSFFWGGLMLGRLLAAQTLNTALSRQNKIWRMFFISIGMIGFLYLITGVKFEDGSFKISLLNLQDIYLYAVFVVINFIASLAVFNQPAKALVIFSIINVILLLVAITCKGSLAFWCIIGSGLFFSIGWTNIFSLAIAGLGKYTSQASSILVMAIVGGAVLPGIQSFIIETRGVQLSFIIPLLGVLYLIYYGLDGYKIKSA